MTARDTNLPNRPAERDATTGVGVTRVSHDKAAVIVWRTTADAADDPDATASPDTDDSPLTSRLARHLVAIYSDVHGTVIDFDADVNLRHAAETTGRDFLAVTNPAGLTASADQPRAAALIMLRWPRPATTAPGQDVNSLLSACRQHLAGDGSTIVVVTAATAGTAGPSYSEHERVLLLAAEPPACGICTTSSHWTPTTAATPSPTLLPATRRHRAATATLTPCGRSAASRW
jgi:hypothetical protein